MGEILITFMKQSSAHKLKKAADYHNISTKIVQSPKELSIGGCSYAVRAKRTDGNRLINLCSEYDIDYRRVFAIYTDTNGHKVYSQTKL